MIKKFLAGLFCLLSTITGIVPAGAAVASAAEETPEIEYTSVLYDLQQDENFDATAYPYIADDYSLQVITIAESVNDELFVYVYQPAGPSRRLEATAIRMATPETGIETTWHDYGLTLISSASVFHKYRVEDFTVKDTSTRYYDITAIHRLWYADIDAPSGTQTDQQINEVVFGVAKIYRANTDDKGFVSYYHDSDVVTVTGKVVGYIYYENPTLWYNAACDRHIVAFSVDRAIDKLYEVDLEYKSCLIADGWYNGEYIVGGNRISDFVDNKKTLQAEKNIIYDENDGLSRVHYSWDQIQTTKEFLDESADVNFKKGSKEDLEETDFVLTFDATSVDLYGSIIYNGQHYGYYRTSISNVTIIRLKFEVNGEMFNLGVVDNKQTGSQLGQNSSGIDWQTILFIAAVVLIVIFTLKYEGFRKVVFWILKAVGVVIAWPVLLTILIVQKVKGG